MKYLLIAGMCGMIFMLAYRIVLLNQIGTKEIARDVARLYIASASSILFCVLTLLQINEVFAKLSYGLYFWCSDFLLLFFFRYIRNYTQEFRNAKICMYMLDAGILLDGVLCIANVFTDCLFSVIKSRDTYGDTYFKIVGRTNLYQFHKGFLYLFVGLILVVLITAIVKAANVYVKQYFAITYCFIFSLVLSVIYDLMEFEFDCSALIYGIMVLLIHYFTFSYVPKGLVEKTLALIVRNISDGVLCMDISGRCIYANAYVKQVFHAKKDNVPMENYYREWVGDRKPKEIEETCWQGESEVDGKKRFFTVRYRRIWDDENKFIGCFFVIHDETEHQKKFEEERYKNSHDALTGLYNREYFYEIVEQQISNNPNVRYSILCSDIQNFKIINDVFGVKKGDEVLVSIADMFRSLATGDTICARLSGDRFALCLRDEKIDHERYLEALSHVTKIGEDSSYQARIYTGICPISNIKTPVSVYCDRAILAIESIKGDYQQSIAYYDENIRKQMLEGQHMVNDFRSAIARKEFQIFLQPQMDAAGNMIGAEALVRWFRSVRGMMKPEEFIHIFEHSGLISAMDQYVWELACKQLKKWKDSGNEQYYISVNVSPKDFYFLDIYRTLTTLVECYEINPKNLQLEITETSVMKDAKKHLALLDELRAYGFRIVMDDFGSGYSSLNMLQDMNIDSLKIDMEFLRKNDDPERSQMILEMILNLAGELGIEVITEGVEQQDQLQYMQNLGCTMFQGYYFAKPMPVEKFEQKYL